MADTACRHPEPVEVHDVTGQLVANLCPTCDEQLPADYNPHAYPQIRLKTVLG